MWYKQQGIVNQTLQGHSGYVACIKITGKRAFSGSWDTTIRSWNIEVKYQILVDAVIFKKLQRIVD